MERFANDKLKYGEKIELVWKYILFGHNDSDRELKEAQKMAMEIGVDVLLFHVTPYVNACKKSKYFKMNNVVLFPRVNTDKSSLRIVYPDNNNPANNFMKKVYNNKLSYIAWWVLMSILLPIKNSCRLKRRRN